MTLEQLRRRLRKIARKQQKYEHSDYEMDHGDADELLLEYINDEKVWEAFRSIRKWYA